MKNVVKFFAIVMFAIVFNSCTKEMLAPIDPESGIVRNDKPPKDMFEYDRQYGDYYSVYVEKADLENAIYSSQYSTNSYQYYDSNTGMLVIQNSFQDFYKITAKKYWGLFQMKIYVSQSTDYFLVSASDLDYIKDIVTRKGAAVVDINGYTYDSRWRTISGAK